MPEARETAESLADTSQPVRTVHLNDNTESTDDPMGEPVDEVQAEPSPEAEADQDYPEGAREEGIAQPDDQGGSALAREEEEAFEPDPVVEVEGEDLETVRTRAANTITRAVRSGRFRRALATAIPPNPPPLDPEYLNTPHRPQVLPPHVKLRRPPPPKASARSLPMPAQAPKAEAPQPEPNQPKGAQQPRQRGFVIGFSMLRANHPRNPSQWKRLATVYTIFPTMCGGLVPLESSHGATT